MDLGKHKIINEVYFNGELITIIEVLKKYNNNDKIKTYNYYSNIGGEKLLPTDIKIICSECGSESEFKSISIKHTENLFLCRKCRSSGKRNGMYGKKHSIETKEEISKRMSGDKNHFYGKKHSEVFKKKLSGERKGVWGIGEDNAMFGVNVFDILVEKHGIIEAEKIWKNKYINHSENMKGTGNPFYNKKHSEESIENIIVHNKPHMLEWKESGEWGNICLKISNSLKGRVFTDEHKQKLRLSAIKNIEERSGQVIPNYNPKGCKIFDGIMLETNTFIQHAENIGEFKIKELGYWVDGYDIENNIVYEFDEKRHFNRDGTLKTKDINREKEIINTLNCKFIRIKDNKV